MPNRSIVSLDIGVLLRLDRLDILDAEAPLCRPCCQLTANKFRSNIDPNNLGLATPFNNPVQASHHPLGWQRQVHLNAYSAGSPLVHSECGRPAYSNQPKLSHSADTKSIGHSPRCVGCRSTSPANLRTRHSRHSVCVHNDSNIH